VSEFARHVDVRTPAASYRVVIGVNAIQSLGDGIIALGARPWVHVIADRRVWELHAAPIVRALETARVQFQHTLIPPGETSKSLATLENVLSALASAKHERREAIVAMGGGVTTDLAGFAAAIWKRGVPWICCPTTLEAAIDAGIGGKTAINLPAGKNLVGAFHHPAAVIIDLSLLGTLSQRDYVAALAESVKHAVVALPEFLDWQRNHASAILNRDADVLSRFIETNVSIKARIIETDERESSSEGVGRAALNLGHTIGHALEAMPHLALRHGEAVALGLRAALSIAVAETQFPSDACIAVESLLDIFGLPRRAPAPFDPADILTRIGSDKKNKDGHVRFVLPRRLGELVWWTPDNAALIERALAVINQIPHG